MKSLRAVPTLLALALAVPLVGQDHVAPVIGFTVNDSRLTTSPADASVGSNGTTINLGDSLFAYGLFAFDSEGGFVSFGNTAITQGIAVVGATGNGVWTWSDGTGTHTLLHVSESTARLLPLYRLVGFNSSGPSYAPNQLIFVPAPDVTVAESQATLIFRAVDDVSVAPDTANGTTAPYGGSPTNFSAESRTLVVPITPVNDAPEWNGVTTFSRNSLYSPSAGGQPVDMPVATLIGTQFANGTDPDGTGDLGVLVTNLNSSFDYQRVPASGAPESISLGGFQGILLAPTDILRITPRPGRGLGTFPAATIRLWDCSDESIAGEVIDTGELNTGGSAPFSDFSDSFSVQLVPDVAPVIVNDEVILPYRPGLDSIISTVVSATDSDSDILDIGFSTKGGVSAFDYTDSASGVLAQWGSLTTASTSLSSFLGNRPLHFTNLPNQTGQIASFTNIVAKDDPGALSTAASYTLVGDTAPQWTANVGYAVAGAQVAEDFTLQLDGLTIADPDVDSPGIWSEDFLTFGTELGSQIIIPTAQGGTAELTLVDPLIDPEQTARGQETTSGGALPAVPSNGLYSVSVLYTPALDFNGTDTFTISLHDSLGLSASLPVSVNVTPVNDPPSIDNLDTETRLSTQTIAVAQGQSTNVNLTATDPDLADTNPDVLTWTQVGASALGTVTLSGSPGAAVQVGFTAGSTIGTEKLEFRVTDSGGVTRNVRIPVSVSELPVAPVITTTAPLIVNLAAGSSTNLDVTAVDPNTAEVLTWSVAQPSGLVSITAPSTPGFSARFAVTAGQQAGTGTAQLRVTDSTGRTATIAVQISVIPVNHPPSIANVDPETRLSTQSIAVSQGQSATVNLTAADPDPSEVLTWSQVGAATLGTVTLSGSPGTAVQVAFIAGQTTGTDILEFLVTDSLGLTSNVRIPVSVSEAQVVPVITTPVPLIVQLTPGASTVVNVVAVDPNTGEILTWSVAQTSALVAIAPPQSPGFSASFTIIAGSQAGTGSAVLRVTDLTGQTATIPVQIAIVAPGNRPPVINAPEAGTSLGQILGGTSRAVSARATDPDAGAVLTWSIATQPTKGSLSPTSGSGASVSFLYTAGLLASGADTFELQVADGRGGSARVVVNASVVPNMPPDVSTPIGVSETQNGTVLAVAVRGQPFRTLIGGDDQETPRTVAVTITGTLPSGIVFNSSGNSGVLVGTPSVAGSFNFSIALDDGVNRTITPVQLTVVEPVTASVASPTIPVSTPDRTAYGSFLPGSAENFSALATALEGRLPSQSRAFWWNATTQSYAELPSVPAAGTEAWHAVWLASTTPITLPSTMTAVAMPYAVDLAPGWTFFGVPPVTDGTTVITTHAWATFQVQSDAGVPLSATQRASAFGNADAGGPFAWDSETYARTTSLVTGAGYWLKNTSGTPLRLVRTATANLNSLALRATSVRADEQPPAPPGGKAARASDASGGCGAGSGIGLFGLSMAFLFTRLRRRG